MRKKIIFNELMQLMRKYLIVAFFAVVCSFLSLTVNAQNVTITGSVNNTSGEPIPGVTIIVQGTSQGTVTGTEGNYSLQNVPRDAALVFSFVGLKTQVINVEGRTNITVTMQEEMYGIEEIVAVGYGTARKADLTGSVATLQGDELLNQKSTALVNNALQGAIPGLTLTRSNADPGSVGSIRIRGVTTIGNSDPLVIVDGIPGTLSRMKMDDIESISVLKDAASASIYGSKAAAGVILVTTKRAKEGQLNFQYDVQYGFDSPTRMLKKADAVTYMKMSNELKWNDNNNQGSEYPVYPLELIENYPSLHAENPDRYPDTDWTQYIGNLTPRYSHALSFSVGEKNFSTRGSVTYDKIESILENRPYENFTARVNNDVHVNEVISLHLDIQYFYSYDQRQQLNPSPARFNLEPLERPYWTDGRIADVRNSVNYIARMLDGGFNKQYNNRANGKFGFDIKPVDGLKLTGVFAPIFNFYKQKNHFKELLMTSWDDPNNVTGWVGGRPGTNLYEYRNDSKEFTSQLLANYLKTFGNHNFNLLAGYEYYYSYSENLSASRLNFTLDNYPYLNLGPLDFRDNAGTAWEYASRSYFGRIMYNFRNKYLFQANARYDGSSRFHKDYRYGLFPSFSVGWVISDEPFLEAVSALSFLKIRASYGSLGNERIGNYPYQSTVSFGNSLLWSGQNVEAYQTAYIPRYAVPNITWETTKSYNFGADINFFEDNLQLTADYYKKTTSDMLLALEIPDFIGLDNPDQNTGEMYTKGWELSVRYRNNFGDLRYSITGNLFDSKSIMGDLGGTEFLGDQVKFEGSEFNEWYGYLSDGLYQTQEEVDNSATINNRTKPGDIKYIDISGPDGVPDGKISAEYDRVLLGGSLPRYEYGGNIRLDYKNFDFSLVFQGVGKRNTYLSHQVVRPLEGGVHSIPSFVIGNYWSHYNTEEQNRNALYPRLSEVAAGSQNRLNGHTYVTSDYWLIDGSYFRLKNIILGYSIPKRTIERLGLESLRIYGNLADIFSIDKFPEGWDPEQSYDGYFITKSYLFGVSIKF